MELSPAELQRYARHLSLAEIGWAGQQKLKAASVLIVGAGGLGSPAAMYLAAAGVGRIGLVDFDVVDASNLQRQILHGQSSLGKKKVESGLERLLDINPHIHVDTYDTPLTSANAMNLLTGYDVVADGSDNFPTRYLLNDVCTRLGKPNVYGSIFRFEGQMTVFDARRGPCYRCLFPEPPPPGSVASCAEGGVLGVLPGIIGVLQATEVVKMLVGVGEPMLGRLLLVDALEMRFRELKLRKDPSCQLCGQEPTIVEPIDYQQFCGMKVGDPGDETIVPISPQELYRELKAHPPFLLDVRETAEWELGHLPGAHLIPLGELSERLREVPQGAKVVVYCRSGGRSRQACRLLKEEGYYNLADLAGGMDAWARSYAP